MRRTLSLLLALLLAACVAPPPPAVTPAWRYAGLVAQADEGTGRMLDHLARRESAEIEQAAALRFAAGAAVPRALPVRATPMAGAVLEPAMDLMAMQARRLAALSTGAAPIEGAEGGIILARLQDALAALRRAPGRWPGEAARRQGIDGFRTLSGPVPAGMDAARLAADRQRAMVASVALMRAVMGGDARSGLRGVLAQRHEAWREANRAMLAASRADRSLGPAERIALFNRVQATLAADPPDLPAAELVALLDALPAGHAAAGAGDGAGVAAFEAALARFLGVLLQAR